MNKKIKSLLIGLVGIAFVGSLYAAALTANRDTRTKTGDTIQLVVKDAEIIFAGSLVSVDVNGEAVSATDLAADHVVGRCELFVDNTDDGLTVTVRRGIFLYESANAAITDALIGDVVFVLDDQTVGRSVDVTNDCEAGIIVDVDSRGIWIDTRIQTGP